MKFLSIKEYFYKLNTIGFILLLLPLLVFIFLYYWLTFHSPRMANTQSKFMLVEIVLVASLLTLTSVHLAWYFKMKRTRKLLELARKMDGYYSFTFMKMIGYCGCSLIMSAGFYLTGDSWFTTVFMMIAFGIAFQWPSRRRFCRQFHLRGGERDMIMNNRDFFKKYKRG